MAIRKFLGTVAFLGLTVTVICGCQQSSAGGQQEISNPQQKQTDEQDAKYWKRHCCRRGGRNGNH
jgi:hypothetical protein